MRLVSAPAAHTLLLQDLEYLYLVMELVRGRELLRLINACAAAVRSHTKQMQRTPPANAGSVADGNAASFDPLRDIQGYRLNPAFPRSAAAVPPLPELAGSQIACSVALTRFYAAQVRGVLQRGLTCIYRRLRSVCFGLTFILFGLL